MIKKFISLCLLSFSVAFGNIPDPAEDFLPPRTDKLDDSSNVAKLRLSRAENILATLVPDPESYHLVLSSTPAFGGEAVAPYIPGDQPTIILYQGALSPDRSNEEIAFMMAHEMGHLQLGHHEEMDQMMEKIFTGSPIEISGLTFTIYFQKLQERQADLFGLNLYREAGYDMNFFPYTLRLININPNIHYGTNRPFREELSSLSFIDSHFAIKERFELLVKEADQAVIQNFARFCVVDGVLKRFSFLQAPENQLLQVELLPAPLVWKVGTSS